MDRRLSDRLWIWIDSLNGWIVVIVNHLSVWIGSSLRIRMKGGRLSVRMKNNRLNHGTNNDWTDDSPNNDGTDMGTDDGTDDWTDDWANNDWTNDGANGGANNNWTNNNRGLMVSSKFIFENALPVAIGEFKSASTTISCF